MLCDQESQHRHSNRGRQKDRGDSQVCQPKRKVSLSAGENSHEKKKQKNKTGDKVKKEKKNTSNKF